MMATALENNGATVYIIGRRMQVLEKAVRENNVRLSVMRSGWGHSGGKHLASKAHSGPAPRRYIPKHPILTPLFFSQRYGKIIPLQGDITSRESLLDIVDEVKARHGYIDLLVNNAGIARNLYSHPLPAPYERRVTNPPSPPDSPPSGPAMPSIKAFQSALWETGSPNDFAETFATNVTSVYYTTVAFLDLLHQGNVRQQRHEFPIGLVGNPLPRPPYHSSQVLSVSSSGSFRLDSKILSPSYTLSKSACTHLGKLLANLLAPWGIRSNVLAPGVWPSGKRQIFIHVGHMISGTRFTDMTYWPCPYRDDHEPNS